MHPWHRNRAAWMVLMSAGLWSAACSVPETTRLDADASVGGQGGGDAGTSGNGGSSAGMGGGGGYAGGSGTGGLGGSAGDGGADGGAPCTEEGARVCKGSAQSTVLKCVNGVWAIGEQCPSGQLCDSKDGSCAVIVAACAGRQPGDAVCDGKDRVVCGPDLVTSTTQTCGSVQLCQLSVGPTCAVCLDGQHQCSDKVLEVCKADHSGFVEQATCDTAALCNADLGECTSKACLAGAFKCVGDQLQQCNSQETAYEKVSECAGGMCDAALGQCNTCTPGVLSCADLATSLACQSDGKTLAPTACPPERPHCVGSGICVQCLADTECPGSGDECISPLCSNNSCTTSFKPVNTAVPVQTPNDCSTVVCDGSGSKTTIADPADLPVEDGNVCTNPTCNATQPVYLPVTNGTGCNETGVCNEGVCGSCQTGTAVCISGMPNQCVAGEYQAGTCPGDKPHCTGAAECVQCLVATHCTASGECLQPTCISNVCGDEPKSAGTLTANQVPGDCKKRVCDGGGGVTTLPLLSDLPADDGNPCTDEKCDASGNVIHPNTAAGTQCGSGKICSGTGYCGVCIPGNTRCYGKDVQLCTNQGQWSVQQTCSGGNVCRVATCVAQGSCVGLATTCGATSNVNCCASTVVSGGSFYMGQPQGGTNLGGNDNYTAYYTENNEAPEHSATVAAYKLDRFEVTVGRFRKFVDAYPFTPAQGDGAVLEIAGSGWQSAWNSKLQATKAALMTRLKSVAKATWTDSPGSNENLPINVLDYYTAYAFCIWDGGRLPTEAEWEYAAANGAEDRFYPWGASVALSCEYSNSWNSCQGGEGVPRKVGDAAKGLSAYSNYDMTGNVWEWVYDQRTAYSANSCTLGACVVQPPAVSNAFSAVLKGSSFGNEMEDGRNARRGASSSGSVSQYVGMRCMHYN